MKLFGKKEQLVKAKKQTAILPKVIIPISQCVLMNDYPTKCSVTRAYMPTNASLLQFRQHFVKGHDGAASSGNGVLLPDFMPKMIGINQYVDRLTG